MTEKKADDKARAALVEDEEIKVLFKAGQQLQTLDADARARCLFYLCQKYAPADFEFRSPSRSTGPSEN